MLAEGTCAGPPSEGLSPPSCCSSVPARAPGWSPRCVGAVLAPSSLPSAEDRGGRNRQKRPRRGHRQNEQRSGLASRRSRQGERRLHAAALSSRTRQALASASCGLTRCRARGTRQGASQRSRGARRLATGWMTGHGGPVNWGPQAPCRDRRGEEEELPLRGGRPPCTSEPHRCPGTGRGAGAGAAAGEAHRGAECCRSGAAAGGTGERGRELQGRRPCA